MNINQLGLQKEFQLLGTFYFECGRWPKDLMEFYYYADRENMHLEISKFGLEIVETHPMEIFKLRLKRFAGSRVVIPYGEIKMEALGIAEDSITCKMTTRPEKIFDPEQTTRNMVGTIGFAGQKRGRSELLGR